MGDSKTQVEVNPGLTFAELWIEFKTLYPKAPGRSQFYEWLKAACIHPSKRKRGGLQQKQLYNPVVMKRLLKLVELRQEFGTLEKAKEKLLEDIKKNPNYYFIEE